MRKFRERNLYAVAGISTVVLVIAGYLALNFSKLPLVSNQRTYQADFATAAGLAKGDVVTVAGVRVGAVTGMQLHGGVARLSFSVSGGPRLGSQTRIDAKVLNPVGVEYLELTPDGPGHLSSPIPIERTTVPGTLVGDLDQLTTQTQQTNLDQVVRSLQVITQTFAANTPAETKAALDGVAELSAVFAAKQDEVGQLVVQADNLASTLNSDTNQLVSLLSAADVVLQVLNERKAAIDNLLSTTTALTQRLDHLVLDDRSVLDPLLSNLQTVSASLANDSGDLGKAIPLLAAFARYSANATGSGPFADVVAPGLVIPDNLIAQCAKLGALDPQRGCRV
ncbi:MAG TPA: MlaD family protein [Acidimicrobiales bacterium]|nr:MlaD family protein [Acidimicrobiales bacterium]